MTDQRSFSLPSHPFRAEVVVPGDKSLGHRALLLAAMAEGESVISGLSAGADIAATQGAVSALGVSAAGSRFLSPGIDAWSVPAEPLDCANSGTTMRLLAGALAGSNVSATLVGDESLMGRPMDRVVDPLIRLGATVTVQPDGTAPLSVSGTRLRGAQVDLAVASAQVRTAVALAALRAEGRTTISSPPGYRDHTERWLAHLGLGSSRDARTYVVEPGPVPPLDVHLPGDPSSAAFLWAAAALLPGARVVTPSVSLNEGRTGLLEVIGLMGGEVIIEPGEPVMGDPVGDVTVIGQTLRGVTVEGQLATRTLDELPLVAVLAAAAVGETVIADAGELQVKESDRIRAGVALADAAGGRARATGDGIVVLGRDSSAPGHVDARGDHRVAMAGAIAALARGSTVSIAGFSAAGVSWPDFDDVLEALWS